MIEPLRSEYTIDDIEEQANRVADVVERVRNSIFSPDYIKKSPIFSIKQVAALCRLDRSAFARRLAKGDLPPGTEMNRSKRDFTLAEARVWARAYNRSYKRKSGDKAVVITTGNSKGGVSKTTTTMCMAQGLSLLGYRVLCVDLDPQGSLTSLCGYLPDTQVQEEDTVLSLCAGEQTSLDYAVRQTYWDGIDVVACAPVAFAAEFHIPSRQSRREPGFQFYDVINSGLESLRNIYDVILIDTSPTLSYLSLNAFYAADGLVMPMPPRGMDFASSSQFWTLFSGLATTIAEQTGSQKTWKFIDVLLCMTEGKGNVNESVVREWIKVAYGDKLMTCEIPKTVVTSSSGTKFSTVYDIEKYVGSAKTYENARVAYDAAVEQLESQIRRIWANQTVGVEG
ncbi:AAA family ATPase [Robbsia andropogonis]|uniref:AAA family ATPase n=2 Tax=Robbsia andropogonis TaxID=28092 RepID=UPI0004667409|nr:AAA family ATPase [Robbsia andropogonis]MCP1118545.1 AAA family ATPase [Robbsia andropogonis]MCP1128012.1 AAA family ATPase [Robbsia andropogonis]